MCQEMVHHDKSKDRRLSASRDSLAPTGLRYFTKPRKASTPACCALSFLPPDLIDDDQNLWHVAWVVEDAFDRVWSFDGQEQALYGAHHIMAPWRYLRMACALLCYTFPALRLDVTEVHCLTAFQSSPSSILL